MQKNRNLVAICGMAGSGKTETKDFFVENGFTSIKFGVTEFVIEKYGNTTEELERMERNSLREKQGMAAFAKLALPKIKSLLQDGQRVVIENMYSWSEYKLLKAEFPQDFVSVALLASPTLRYDRLVERVKIDGRTSYLDKEMSKLRDYSEIEEIEKGGPIAMSDYYVINEGSLENLHEQLQSILGLL